MTRITSEIRRRLRPLHEHENKALWHLQNGLIHVSLVVACLAAWIVGWWPLGVLLWFGIAWMHHAALVRLHEAAHSMLFESKPLNDAVGIGLGTLALLPLSVYRHVHTLHHAHLGSAKDPELRPYNQPETSRLWRLLCAWGELLAGWIVTPCFYSYHTACDWKTITKKRRRRLVIEWGVMLGFWSAVLAAVAVTGTWKWFVVGHLVPAWITGSAQTVRKFTEHLGRFGEDMLDMTRTIVYTRPVGQAASRSQLHVEHHGTHHRWPGIPYHNMPEATPIVFGDETEGRIFPGYYAAMKDMLPHLWNPRTGPQWNEKPRETYRPKRSTRSGATSSAGRE